jgi:hypothetical protein
MSKRDRGVRGAASPNAKLDDERVRRMRHLRETEKTSYEKLGAIFGVSDRTAERICKFQAWKHVR